MPEERRQRGLIPPVVKFHQRVDDDLLNGFRQPGGRPGELRGFFATTIAISLVVWDLAFALGGVPHRLLLPADADLRGLRGPAAGCGRPAAAHERTAMDARDPVDPGRVACLAPGGLQ